MELSRSEKLVIAQALQQLAMTQERLGKEAETEEWKDEYFELAVETNFIYLKFMEELGLQ